MITASYFVRRFTDDTLQTLPGCDADVCTS
jgi:hypothetical protein